jgi:hypothetical protein
MVVTGDAGLAVVHDGLDRRHLDPVRRRRVAPVAGRPAMSAVLLLRVTGPAEVAAVLRPLAATHNGVVLVLADEGLAAQPLLALTRPLLDAAEWSSLAGQLGTDT